MSKRDESLEALVVKKKNSKKKKKVETVSVSTQPQLTRPDVNKLESERTMFKNLILESVKPGMRDQRLMERGLREAASMLIRGESGTLTIKEIKSEKDADKLEKEIQGLMDEAMERYHENQLDQLNHMRMFQMKQLYNKAQVAIKLARK